MFRDAQEELERLQAQLLEETEEDQVASEEEDFLQEEDFDALLYDTDQGESPQVYENFSNDYGRDLRNYATGYKAYNADTTDTDLDTFSEEVFQGKKVSYGWLWVLVVLIGLMLAVNIGIVWFYLSVGGLG